MSAASWNLTYSYSNDPRMRRRKREVRKTLNTIRRRKDQKQWQIDCEMRRGTSGRQASDR